MLLNLDSNSSHPEKIRSISTRIVDDAEAQDRVSAVSVSCLRALGVIRTKMRDLNARWGSKNSEEERKRERERGVSLVVWRVRLWVAFRPLTAEHDVPSLPLDRLFFSPIPSASFPAFTCHESGFHERGLFSKRRATRTTNARNDCPAETQSV